MADETYIFFSMYNSKKKPATKTRNVNNPILNIYMKFRKSSKLYLQLMFSRQRKFGRKYGHDLRKKVLILHTKSLSFFIYP